jgi:hypothetical protein
MRTLPIAIPMDHTTPTLRAKRAFLADVNLEDLSPSMLVSGETHTWALWVPVALEKRLIITSRGF